MESESQSHDTINSSAAVAKLWKIIEELLYENEMFRLQLSETASSSNQQQSAADRDVICSRLERCHEEAVRTTQSYSEIMQLLRGMELRLAALQSTCVAGPPLDVVRSTTPGRCEACTAKDTRIQVLERTVEALTKEKDDLCNVADTLAKSKERQSDDLAKKNDELRSEFDMLIRKGSANSNDIISFVAIVFDAHDRERGELESCNAALRMQLDELKDINTRLNMKVDEQQKSFIEIQRDFALQRSPSSNPTAADFGANYGPRNSSGVREGSSAGSVTPPPVAHVRSEDASPSVRQPKPVGDRSGVSVVRQISLRRDPMDGSVSARSPAGSVPVTLKGRPLSSAFIAEVRCDECTFLNVPGANVCDMCLRPLKKPNL